MIALNGTRITSKEISGKTNLAELEGVLFASELKVSGDEDEHAVGGTRGLAIDGGDVVLALLERKAGELGDDVLRALDLLPFEAQHGSFLVQRDQPRAIRIERRVVVLHEGLGYCVWIHLSFDPSLSLRRAFKDYRERSKERK